MAEPVYRVQSGEKHVDLADLMAHEMIQITKWTGIKKQREFYDAIRDEDPAAILALFTVAAWRETGPTESTDPPKFGSVAVSLDVDIYMHIDGRRVRMMLEKDDSGEVRRVVADASGLPKKALNGDLIDATGDEDEKWVVVPLRHDGDGALRYEYIDTGEEVPPTKPTPGSTDSAPTAKTSTSDSASSSQRPADALV